MKKTPPKRGRGLSGTAKVGKKRSTISQPEDAPAAVVRAPARTHRVSTNIADVAADDLEKITAAIRKETGRKPLIAEVLEMGLAELKKKYVNT